jgi:hypothetical protein
MGFTAALRRPFGVSRIFARLLNGHEERQAEKTERVLASHPDAVREALVAAERATGRAARNRGVDVSGYCRASYLETWLYPKVHAKFFRWDVGSCDS